MSTHINLLLKRYRTDTAAVIQQYSLLENSGMQHYVLLTVDLFAESSSEQHVILFKLSIH